MLEIKDLLDSTIINKHLTGNFSMTISSHVGCLHLKPLGRWADRTHILYGDTVEKGDEKKVFQMVLIT